MVWFLGAQTRLGEFDRVSKRKDEGGEDEESELEDAESRKSYSYVNLLTLFRIDNILIVDQGPVTAILGEGSNAIVSGLRVPVKTRRYLTKLGDSINTVSCALARPEQHFHVTYLFTSTSPTFFLQLHLQATPQKTSLQHEDTDSDSD